jgi:3-hydroxypropanoate dehydrogenase
LQPGAFSLREVAHGQGAAQAAPFRRQSRQDDEGTGLRHLGYDLDFYEYLPKLFPHTDARSWFAGKKEKIFDTAFRNGTLQGAYLIMAARALGLDFGPMSGFDNQGVDREFFAGTNVRSNFLCSLGYGDGSVLFPRSPRFEFDEMARIL